MANGIKVPIESSGSLSFTTPNRPLALKSVLVTQSLIKNLISVRRFSKDNSCSVEFDPFGFTLKDLRSQKRILHSDSTGDLYPLLPSPNKATSQPQSFLTTSSNVWHRCLAHCNNQTLNSLLSNSVLSCNKRDLSPLCSACQFGKQTKLPFTTSNTIVNYPFDIVHSELWTSPIQSLSGIKYYVLFLDHYSHFLWVYPLRYKHETFSKFLHFTNFVKTQFGKDIKSLQCDNGGEFDNSQFHDFFASKGITFHFSCPHTSQQNGKSERMIRTINNVVRCLLFQAQLPLPSGWRRYIRLSIS